MDSAKVIAAAVIVAVAAAVIAVGAVLTAGPADPPAPVANADVTREPVVPSTEAAPMVVVPDVASSAPPPPPPQTVAPTFDPAVPPAVEIHGDPGLRAINLLFSGFEPGEVVVVTVEGREAAQMEMGETGAAEFRGFDYHLTLPDGHHEFTATGRRSGRSLIFGLDV
ncbi:hypothetical protein FDA94_32350 [Herbidospora galbida]|uniref:Uncharacterized protein n=1 Tax=Herbidospora galbida TaxID=2575442 RepID=A0A4U3M4Q1_9ACTN|nr:hypothetical protein [Herbidospora galbida]TKK83805.1 hypothetical protein FDA94_32350 [Herbidospora galbida]